MLNRHPIADPFYTLIQFYYFEISPAFLMNQFSVAPPFTVAKNISMMKATVNLVRMLSAKKLKRY